jgi:hypothetical protein
LSNELLLNEKKTRLKQNKTNKNSTAQTVKLHHPLEVIGDQISHVTKLTNKSHLQVFKIGECSPLRGQGARQSIIATQAPELAKPRTLIKS